MPDLPTATGSVHVICGVHVHYSRAHHFAAPLNDPEDVAGFLRRVVSNATREHAVAIYLDPKNRPLRWQITSIGSDIIAPVKPLLVLQPVVLLGGSAMTYACNHPSGDLDPPKRPG